MVNLKNLKEKTRELDSFISRITEPDIIYNLKKGECYGYNLLHIPEIAVQKAFLGKGGVFDMHIHKDEIEIIIVYEGKLKGIYNGDEKTINIGDCFRIEKNIPHSWEAVEDTWMIGITIPASGAYPNAD